MEYVLGAFVLLLVVYAAVTFTTGQRHQSFLRQARGTVLDRQFTGRSGTGNQRAYAQFAVRVQFSTAQGRAVDGTARGRYRRTVAKEPGEAIDVWYDHREPEYFQLIPPGSLRSAWPIALILAVVGAVALAVVVL